MAVLLVGCGDSKVDTSNCRAVAPTAPGRTELTVTAKNLSFDVECVKVKPGTVVVKFVNEDKEVAHNFHVVDEGSTKLTRGPDEQTLTLKLTEKGTYDFKCDPHPNMKGAIVVA